MRLQRWQEDVSGVQKQFYIAEDYHKNYFEKNKDAPYCNLVISSKIHKLFKNYGEDIKEEYKK